VSPVARLASGLRHNGFDGEISLCGSGAWPRCRCATPAAAALIRVGGLTMAPPCLTSAASSRLPLLETLENWAAGLSPGPERSAASYSQGNFQLKVSAPLTEGFLYRGCGGSDGLCRGLLATGPRGLIDSHYGVLVRRLERTAMDSGSCLAPSVSRLAVVNCCCSAAPFWPIPAASLVMGWSDIPCARLPTPILPGSGA